MKKRIKRILNFFQISLLKTELIKIYNFEASCPIVSTKLFFTPYSLTVYKNQKKLEKAMEIVIPIGEALKNLSKTEPISHTLSKENSTTDKKHRKEISENYYIGLYGNKVKAFSTISNGRVYWRLETLRRINRNSDLLRGNVLEIGAGSGVGSSIVSNFSKVHKITSMDYELFTVNNLMPYVFYNTNAKTEKISRAIGDFNQMDFEDNSFDSIFALGCLHHSIDLEQTLRECFRVIKPGGHMIISDYAYANDMTQSEYYSWLEKPVSIKEVNENNHKIKRNRDINEHGRPLCLYQSAAFKSGFNSQTYLFDATTSTSNRFSLIWKRLFNSKLDYNRKIDRIMGYDNNTNVNTFNHKEFLYYPFYAKEKPSIFLNLLFGDKIGNPQYDNVLLILEKPLEVRANCKIKFRNGQIYQNEI